MRNLSSKLYSTIALALLSVALTAAVGRAQDAKIIKIVGTGSAMVTHQGSPEVAATEGMAIALNDEIRTAFGVEVYVQAYVGAVATIKENSRVIVSKLGLNEAELELRVGSIVSQLDPAKRNTHNYGVRTPKGVAAARGTVYVTTVNGQNYSVSVLAGNVTVTPILAGGGFGPAVPVVSGTTSDNGANATALAANPDAGNIASAALAAVAVAKDTGALDATASASLLNDTVSTVVATSAAAGNSGAGSILAQATAAAAAAAPKEAAAVVTAAISNAGANAVTVAQTVTNAAAQGAGQAAAKEAAATNTSTTTTTEQKSAAAGDATAKAAQAAQDVAAAATAALKTVAATPGSGITQNQVNQATQNIANAATSGATTGVTTTAFAGNPVTNNPTAVSAQIAQQAVAGANSGSQATGNNQANVGQAIVTPTNTPTNTHTNTNTNNPNQPATPITPIDPTLNVSPSGGP